MPFVSFSFFVLTVITTHALLSALSTHPYIYAGPKLMHFLNRITYQSDKGLDIIYSQISCAKANTQKLKIVLLNKHDHYQGEAGFLQFNIVKLYFLNYWKLHSRYHTVGNFHGVKIFVYFICSSIRKKLLNFSYIIKCLLEQTCHETINQ